MVHILCPDDAAVRLEWTVKVLRETFPAAVWHGLDEFSTAEHICLAEGHVLLIADVEHFPVHLWRPLERYIESGGNAVFWGSRPFAGRSGGVPAQWEAVSGKAAEIPGCSSIQLWSSRAAEGEEGGTLRIVRPAEVPWEAVEVTLADFRTQNLLVSPSFDAAGCNAETFCFYAYGDSNTTRLVVRVELDDGTIWQTTEELDRNWRLHVILRTRFQQVTPTGEEPTEPFAQRGAVKRLLIGLDNEVAPQRPGSHVYGLSDLRLLVDGSVFPVREPDIPMLSPSFNRVSTETSLIQSLQDDGQHELQRLERYESPVLLKNQLSVSGTRGLRAIPLFSGVDRVTGELNGWVATLFVESFAEDRYGVWGWVGLDANERNRRWIGDLLSACVSRVSRGVFITGIPVIPPVMSGNELLEVEVNWAAPLDAGGRLRVTGELLAGDGRRLRRVTSSMLSASDMAHPTHQTKINLGRMPALQTGVQDYIVRLALEDVSASDQIYDESIHPIKVGGTHPNVVLPWLKCSGSRFVSERQAVYIMGVRYAPTAHLMLPAEPAGRWLEAPWFDPEQVQLDMEKLADLNINAVLVPCSDLGQVEGLRYLIHEAEKHGIRVALELEGLSPIHGDMEQVGKLIQALNLEEEPVVFALFFSPETFLGTEEERSRLDPAWREWLTEQYGSLSRAERMLGKPAWSRDGLLCGPSNEELAGRGLHPVAVLVYRRFVDDYLSRRYGCLKRFIRSLGCRQLLSATACAVSDYARYPGDFSAGSLHLDFLSPSAEGCNGPDESFMELGFLTAYGRGGHGFIKPVVWMNFGPPMGGAPQRADLINQERIFDAVFEMVNRSSAAGTFATAYSSARGVEQSDRGIVSPLGEKRPVCMTFSRHMRRLRTSMIYPATWKGRVFSRSAGPEGLAGLLREWRGVYADELAENAGQELRPFGFGRNTTDMPLLVVGGLPHVDPAPLECANAEWGDVWVNGRPVLREAGAALDVEWGDTVRLALVNSGVTAWAAARPDQQGTVWVQVHMPGGRERRMALPMVVPGSEEYVEWTASETGAWTFRATIAGVGDFGELLRIEVGRRGIPGR